MSYNCQFPGTFRPMNILVVDDEIPFHRLVKEWFSIAKWINPVCGATNEAEMNKCLVSERPDLVLLDVRMATESGLDILKKIKTNPETRDTIVVLMGRSHERKEN